MKAGYEVGRLRTAGWLDKIPGVSDVTKITAKTAAEAAIDAGKEKAKEELKKE